MSSSDPISYVTFWAVLSFSFFLASEQLEAPHEAPVLTPALAALRVVVHTSALNCLGITMVEAFRSRHDADWVRRRPRFAEAQAVVGGVALLLINGFVSAQDAFARGAVELDAAVRLVPYLASTATGVAQAVALRRI